MALFKIQKGEQKNLPTTYNEGYAYFTTDQNRFYIDTTNSSSGRKMINPDSIVDITRSGNTFTMTKADGSTDTVTQAYPSNATTSAAGLMSANDKVKLDGLSNYTLPTASSSTLGGVKIGSNISISSGKISVPTASGTQAGVTIVYPAASCTTFSSDSGTVTPLAVQNGAKMFAITRPPKDSPSRSVTSKAIARWLNGDGDLDNSKIIIEDVTNSNSGKKAQVIVIPAEGNKKMVYGYCTDQVDGTSFIGGVFDNSATSYPYNQGLAIGGTSGNLLWKGARVATSDDLVAATTSKNGLMSAADKTKLNKLPSVTTSDNGKFLIVENGTVVTKTIPNAEGASF